MIVSGQSRRVIDSLLKVKCAEPESQSSVVMKLDLSTTLLERICIHIRVSSPLYPTAKKLQGMEMTDSATEVMIGR